MTFVETLQPQAVWSHFDRILAIPHGSGEEARIRDYVVEVAKRNGLEYEVDRAGNVVVRKPATAGKEGAPPVVLQSHLDMVNDKNADVQHDFSKDPIQPRRDGEYLTASGTTLGADNGIGVAAMLAVMEAKDLVHGPLDFLFTVDEETGLTGAQALSGQMLRGRQLLNLDTENQNELSIGCAGGGNSILTLPLETEPAQGSKALRLVLRGLQGGHSGIDIHLQRGNAVKLVNRMVHVGVMEAGGRVTAIEGGNKHNAIPREAEAVVVLNDEQVAPFRARVEKEFAAVRAEYAVSDPDMALEISEVAVPAQVWTQRTMDTALHLIEALPHGVIAMSLDIPGLVETSNNVAVVKAQDGQLVVTTSTRSSIGSALEAVRLQIHAVARLAGVAIQQEPAYPGWKPNLRSEVLGVLREVHREVKGEEPELKAVHAGLECGIIGEKVPGMDMVSFGPQIEFPHSPSERVHIGSVAEFWKVLTRALERLAA